VNEEIKQHLNKPIFFGDCVKQLEIKCDGDGAAKIRRWRDWSVVSRRLRRHGNATQFVDEIRRGSLGLYDGITIRYGTVWYGTVKVKFSHTRYRALGPHLIPAYRQSARS